MRLELNGDWELRNEAGETLCPVEVPGSVVSGLYAAGKIEHPYYRENEYATRELFQKDYEFNAPSAASAVVLGHTSNGNVDWKTEDGTKLKDL